MTQEQVNIIVEANVEKALKEIQKLLPTIKKQLSEIHKEFEKIKLNMNVAVNINMSQVTKQIKQVKKQIQQVFDPNDITGMTINGKAFEIKNIKGYLKEAQSLKGQMGTLNRFKISASQVENTKIPKIPKSRVQAPQTDNTGQSNQYSIWTNMVRKYNAILDVVKAKMHQLRQETEQTGISQNKLTGSSSGLKAKMGQTNSTVQAVRDAFNKIPNIIKAITSNIKKMGAGIKSGLGHVLKYASSLFNLKEIYNTLMNSAQSWLSSQNTDAQQLSANIEYMKYAMGSTFAPVIQYVINLVYQLMKAIQSVVYAFSGVNIFAKATAVSMGETAKGAKQTNKSLVGIHSEINNVSEKDDNGGTGGATAISSNMDLSKLDMQMNPFAQKLYDFFKPLVDSWNTYGLGLIQQVIATANQIGGLIISIWGSFENIITNGTVYSILQNILAIIGNIAEAFANAWNYNGNGDAIVQNLADAFNNLQNDINNVVQSEGFQNFLNWCSDKFREIMQKMESIDWQSLIDSMTTIGEVVGVVALEVLSGLVDVFKWLVENPIVAEVLLAIAVAIGVVSTAIGIWSAVQEILNSILWSSPITWIILAITALIAVIILCILNWEEIKTVVQNVWERIKNAISEAIEPIKRYLVELWQKVSIIFEAIWNIVSPIINAIWQIILTVFQAIWNLISTILGSIWDIFSQIFNWIWELTSRIFQGIWNIIAPIMNTIWNGIKTTLSWIQQQWSNVWNTIASIVNNIWNGIWSCIKGIINAILGGIENMVNGVIKGVNWILSGISNIANAIGGVVGMKQINLRLNYVCLPRLAKGNVAYSPLIAQFGEYAGASHNPEITTPQNIMAETFENVLSSHEWNNSANSNGEIKQLIFQFGSYRVAMEMESLLRQARRQNGTAMITV